MIAQLQHSYFLKEDETIFYCKQLRNFTGSITATILMQRLEHYFSHYPDGFHKFLTKNSKTVSYQSHLSWQEELGFTKEEFVSNFNYIGVRYRTKDRYIQEIDPFFNNKNEQKYYCSYYESRTGQTWYFRNHKLVDTLAEKLLIGRG